MPVVAAPRGALAALKKSDATMAGIIAKVGRYRMKPSRERTHFDALARAIMYQQLAGSAAAAIHKRFVALFDARSPRSAQVLKLSGARLRGVGLSRQKAGYLRDLAARIESRELPVRGLSRMTDEEVIRKLTEVKGIGRWTAQIFLLSRLGRPDVLPEADYGLQKAVQLAYRMRTLPKPARLAKVGEAWRPFRSVAAWYLWHWLDQR